MSEETRTGGGERPGADQPPASAAAPSDAAEARIEALEREVETLRAVNAKLMRDRLGRSNTAAAGELVAGPTAVARAGSASARALAPLRRLRLAVRRVLLRVLR